MILPAFLEALPLSLRTFWRYLILLPFLAIGALLVSLAGLIPILGLVVAPAVSVGLLMIGLRCALAARGHGNPLDVRSFVISCLIFGTFNLLISKAFSLVYPILVAITGSGDDPLGPFARLFWAEGAAPYRVAMLLAFLIPPALVAASFAVPMTAAAEAATPKGGGTSLLFGFGAGLVSLLVVSAVWLLGGNFFSIFGEVWTSLGLLVSALAAWYQGESRPWTFSLNPLTALGGTVFMAWASSWYFATAVIVWERKTAAEKSARTVRAEERRPSSESLRDLRKKRMHGDHV